RYADGLISTDELLAVSLAHFRDLFPDEEESALRFVSYEADYAVWIADWAVQETRYAGDRSWPAGAAEAREADLLRAIFGNPFRPVAIDPSWLSWNGGTLPEMARAIYDERRFEELPVLADALERAGCADRDILAHCRGPGEHVRGCWVLDL